MSQQRDSGLAALQQGNVPTAISLLEAACNTSPNDYLAHQFLGMAYQQAGRSQDAMQTLTKAVHLNPTDAQARYNLGVAMEAAGFSNEAKQIFNQLCKTNYSKYEERQQIVSENGNFYFTSTQSGNFVIGTP